MYFLIFDGILMFFLGDVGFWEGPRGESWNQPGTQVGR